MKRRLGSSEEWGVWLYHTISEFSAVHLGPPEKVNCGHRVATLLWRMVLRKAPRPLCANYYWYVFLSKTVLPWGGSLAPVSRAGQRVWSGTRPQLPLGWSGHMTGLVLSGRVGGGAGMPAAWSRALSRHSLLVPHLTCALKY